MDTRNSRLGWAACAILALAGGGLALAAESSGTASTSASALDAPTRHWHGARGAMPVRILLRATRELNLSSSQQQQIRALLMQARSARPAGRLAQNADFTVLGNPGDPGYASAMQSLKSAADQRLDAQSALAQSIYNVLTPDQQKALPGVLSELQAKVQARRAAWRQQHAQPGSSTTG